MHAALIREKAEQGNQAEALSILNEYNSTLETINAVDERQLLEDKNLSDQEIAIKETKLPQIKMKLVT